MDDARAQRTASLTRYRNLKFPLDTKNTPYEAKIKFTAREVESFDVNFLFDIAGINTVQPQGPDDVIANQ